jgi:hypothetical protein
MERDKKENKKRTKREQKENKKGTKRQINIESSERFNSSFLTLINCILYLVYVTNWLILG